MTDATTCGCVDKLGHSSICREACDYPKLAERVRVLREALTAVLAYETAVRARMQLAFAQKLPWPIVGDRALDALYLQWQTQAHEALTATEEPRG